MFDHLDFILWVIGYPIMLEVCRLIERTNNPKYEKLDISSETSFVILSIWAGVGYLLY